MHPQINYELINQLITEEIAEVISEEDLAYLKWAISVDEEANKLREAKRSKLCTPEATEGVKQGFNLDQAIRSIKKPRRYSRILKIAFSTAAAFLILCITYSIFNKNPQPDKQLSSIITTSKKIQLNLPSGQVIDLSNIQGNVKAGTVSLRTQSKTLSYSDQNKEGNGWATLTVPAGKDYKIILEDGTEVRLNATTRLEFPLHFNGNQRIIHISGEAFLKVSNNSQKPFIIQLPAGQIRVLGTAFNVNSYDSGKVTVSLVQGKVRFTGGNDSLQLMPGKEAILNRNSGIITSQSFDEDYTLSWINGIYAFNNSKLEEILQVLPRWFGITLKIENAQLARKRFTGIIDRNQPVKNSLDALKMASDFNYAIEGDVVRIW
jgi:hypothetical protein